MTDKKDINNGRLANGCFKKGVSGNPAGRTKGSGKAVKLSSIAMKKIHSVLVQAALEGDVEAAKLVLEANRICEIS